MRPASTFSIIQLSNSRVLTVYILYLFDRYSIYTVSTFVNRFYGKFLSHGKPDVIMIKSCL